MLDRHRLIPAVILGAMGLLALKALSWTGEGAFTPLAQQVAPPNARPAPDGSYDPSLYRGWTQMWARAREPYVIRAPETTGSISTPAEQPPVPAGDRPPGATLPLPPPPTDHAALLNQGQRPMSPAERALVERLSDRRDEIEARQRELDMREKLLATAEKKLEGRVGELKVQEDKTEPKADAKDSPETQAMKRLVIMYENMKPRDAARVFDRLPPDVLVPVVMQMNPRKMSEVMAAMSADAAERLTVALATKHRQRPAAGSAAASLQALPAGELPALAPPPAAAPAQAPARRP
jgi:flagellar motility protein MotE (MotC chaperone)